MSLDEETISTIDIHSEAIVVYKSVIQGRNVIIGQGTVIHPQAIIDAGQGSIVFGAYNIVEETALVQNLGGPGSVVHIGNENLFEIGSVCQASEVGDNNVFGIQCTVGPDLKITSGCLIGARCTLTTKEELSPLTVIYFEHNQRKVACEKPISPKSQAEFLKKLLPKYSEIIKSKKDSQPRKG